MQELFLELVQLSLIGSLFVLAVILVRIIFRKAPKWLFCLLWSVVALRLICPIFVESDFSLVPDRLASGQIISNVGNNYIGEVNIIYENDAGYSNAVDAGRQPIYSDSGYYVVTEKDSYDAPATVEETVFPVLSWIWLVGMVLMLTYTAVSYLALKRKMEEATLLRDNIWQCEQVESPFVLGIIKPRIYLPYQISDSDMDNVIAHEQAHIHRKDHWWKPIGFLLLAVHWFNPVMWVAYILLCRDIEAACDEKVIKHMEKDEMRAYSTALLHCSVHRRRIAACPLAFGEVGVKERIKRVMNYKKPTFWIMLISIIACVVIAVCFLTNPSDTTPDLSFLNYQNAIPIVADAGELLIIYCPSSEDKGSGASIQIGRVYGADLAKQLDLWDWNECNPPRGSLPSPGSVDFVIEDAYRIVVHQRKPGSLFQYAVVQYQDDVRYYRIDHDDYSDAVGLIHARSEEASILNAQILEINTGCFIVEPVTGSCELICADKIEVPMKSMDPALEPQIGDVIEITYNGEIQDTYPARINEVFGIRVISERPHITESLTLNDVADLVKQQHTVSFVGMTREAVHGYWGEPDAEVHGFLGDIYHVPDSYESIIFRYDKDEIVESVTVEYRNNSAESVGVNPLSSYLEKYAEVDHIMLQNLYTQNTVLIKEKDAIDAIIGYLSNIAYEPSGTTKGWYGGSYAIKLMNGDSEVLNILLADDVQDWCYFGYVQGNEYPTRYNLLGSSVDNVIAFIESYIPDELGLSLELQFQSGSEFNIVIRHSSATQTIAGTITTSPEYEIQVVHNGEIISFGSYMRDVLGYDYADTIIMWDDVLYTIESNGELSINCNFSTTYGILPAGQYLLRKPIQLTTSTGQTITKDYIVEFAIVE